MTLTLSVNKALFRATMWLILLVPVVVPASQSAPDILDPKTYHSPSGYWQLTVDPSDRYGAGEARYDLQRGGETLWAITLPFTFQDAVVSDDGKTAGYAYSRGHWVRFDDLGDFIVAMLGTDGQVDILDSIPRREAMVFHSPTHPSGNGLVVDHLHNRLLLRVLDFEEHETVEAWWLYDLESGTDLGRFRPDVRAGLPSPSTYLLDVHWVKGTPLFLVHVFQFARPCDQTAGPAGSRFVLFDADLQPVWDLMWPSGAQTGWAVQEHLSSLRKRSTMVGHTNPGQFELLHPERNERTRFEVMQDESGRWSVEELESSAELAVVVAPSEQLPGDDSRRLLSASGSINLHHGQIAPAPFHSVERFAIDEFGRFGLISRRCDPNPEALDFVVLDHTGAPVGRIDLLDYIDGCEASLQIAWQSGDQWLVAASTASSGQPATLFRIDVEERTVTPLPYFEAAKVESLARANDDRFVSLSRSDFNVNTRATVSVHDAEGGTLWNLEPDAGQRIRADDIAVARTGEIVTLSTAGDALRLYAADGRLLESLLLEQAWGWTPNYPSTIRADHDGGLLIKDFNGTHLLVWMQLDGSVEAAFTPRFPDGQIFPIHDMAQSPLDGRLWVSDGDALFGLDTNGVVEHLIGVEPDPQVLGDIDQVYVTPAGNVYAGDRQTGAVHGFDKSGRHFFHAQPLAKDHDRGSYRNSLSATNRGDIFIEQEPGSKLDFVVSMIHFDHQGQRRAVIRPDVDSIARIWMSQPDGQAHWLLGDSGLYLVDTQGSVLKAIERGAAGHWLRPDIPAVAPDGSIALLSSRGRFGLEPDRMDVFSATGEPLASWPAPKDLLSFVDFAFDGTLLALLIGDYKEPSTLSILLLDDEGRRLGQFRLEDNPAINRLFLVSPREQVELWVFDGLRTIHRYELPRID